MRVVQGYRPMEEEVTEDIEGTFSSSDERIMNEDELMANAFKRRKIGQGKEMKISNGKEDLEEEKQDKPNLQTIS
jgi:hypothetical protein